ncbi:MAG: RDD family protein [Campylobacterota bacterium]|nr:RDD family protein [Campylobacterota bacterium]
MDINNQVDMDNLQLASMGSRLKAFIIDDLLITLIVLVLLWEQISAASGDLGVITSLMNQAFFEIVALKFIYQTFFIWYYGATLGKIVAKIRVIDYDNFGKVSFMNSLVRSAGRIVSEALFYIGFLMAYYTDSKQTFHDKFGKTLVVNE